VDQEDQGDHNPPWWTRTGFYILLMKAPHPLHKAITPIPVMMDQTRVVEEEEERVFQVGDQTEETLLTHTSR